MHWHGYPIFILGAATADPTAGSVPGSKTSPATLAFFVDEQPGPMTQPIHVNVFKPAGAKAASGEPFHRLSSKNPARS